MITQRDHDRAMAKLRAGGWTYRKIAAFYKVTIEGARQAIARSERYSRREERYLALKRFADHGFRAALLASPVYDIMLSTRTAMALECLGIKTLEELTKLSEVEFSRQVNVGRKSVRELREALAELGISLTDDGNR